jgi:thioredoxin reductase (NADPH)
VSDYDLVIVGAGLAGLTAALFSARHGHHVLALEASMPGGHLVNVEKIEDFPGFVDGIAGYDLCPTVQEQAQTAGAEFALAEVTALVPTDGDWTTVTDEARYHSRAVLVAVGSRPRPLGLEGEERLVGRGLSHCATCDGPLFRGRPVGVVGGGDSALQEALTLAAFASRVTIFQRGDALTAQHVYRARVDASPAIEVRLATTIEAILGDDALAGVEVRDARRGALDVVQLAGLFPYVGLEPRTGFLGDLLPLDGAGHIPTDIWLRTPLPGLFAAGDARQDSAAQAVSAAGDGATAARAVDRYLRDGSWPEAVATMRR